MTAGTLQIPTAWPWNLTSGQRAALDAVMTEALNCDASDTDTAGLVAAVTRAAAAGKRLRPALVLAAAEGDRSDRRAPAVPPAPVPLTGAAAVEMLHWATLVHDDVLDGAGSRHGRPTVNAEEGTAAAVLGGDLLIGTAMSLAAKSGTTVVQCLADTLRQLCAGQAREERQRWNTELDQDDVIAVYAGKTGSLLAAAAGIGGLCDGSRVDDEAARQRVSALSGFGAAFGISLQIVDDVLDLTSSPELLGKPVGADFAAGTVTLPALAALNNSPDLKQFARPGLTAREHQRCLELLRAPCALRYGVHEAYRWADVAARRLRAVAVRESSLQRLAEWPARYVHHMFATKTEARFTSFLIGPPVEGARRAGSRARTVA